MNCLSSDTCPFILVQVGARSHLVIVEFGEEEVDVGPVARHPVQALCIQALPLYILYTQDSLRIPQTVLI